VHLHVLFVNHLLAEGHVILTEAAGLGHQVAHGPREDFPPLGALVLVVLEQVLVRLKIRKLDNIAFIAAVTHLEDAERK